MTNIEAANIVATILESMRRSPAQFNFNVNVSPVVPLFSARPLSSGRAQPYRDPSGPEPTINSNAAKVVLIESR